MYTANSMNCLCEAIGIALPGNGTIPAVYAKRLQLAKHAGMAIMDLVSRGVTARQIINERSIRNALTCDMALGCSTNTVLHLLAIAQEAGCPIDLKLFNEISARTPNLCHLAPAGPTHMPDLYEAGGIPAVQAELAKKNLLDLDVPTVTGKTLGENIRGAKILNDKAIRSIDNPYSQTGGLQILWGNIAPDGCVVKRSAVAPEMQVHSGPARVFDSEDTAIAAIYAGDIHPGDVVVIRYEGPKGGPGMREMLNPTSALAGMKLDTTVALITDGRFSGASRGAAIGTSAPRQPPAAPSVWSGKGTPSRSTFRMRPSTWPSAATSLPPARPPTSSPSRTSRPAGWHGTQGWSPAPIWRGAEVNSIKQDAVSQDSILFFYCSVGLGMPGGQLCRWRPFNG